MSFKCGRENLRNNLFVGNEQIIMKVFNYTYKFTALISKAQIWVAFQLQLNI